MRLAIPRDWMGWDGDQTAQDDPYDIKPFNGGITCDIHLMVMMIVMVMN